LEVLGEMGQIDRVTLIDVSGRVVRSSVSMEEIALPDKGVYVVAITLKNGEVVFQKIVID
jgi:hypothetical protein